MNATLPPARVLVVGIGGLGGTFAGWLNQLAETGLAEVVGLT